MAETTLQCSEAWRKAGPRRALLGAAGLLLGACIVLNLVVNPLGLYWARLFNPAQLNYRAEKYEFVRQLAEPPATVILGSSRVMTMRSADVEQHLPGPCYNCTGLGARAEDYYAGLRLLCEDAALPIRDIVLGVDYEAFCPGAPVMSEARFFPAYRKYLIHNRDEGIGFLERLSLLVANQQVGEAMNVLRRQLFGHGAGPTMTVGPGGEALQPERDEEIAEGRFNLDRILARRVRKYPEHSQYLSRYAAPDEVRLAYLDDFLSYCQQRGIRVHAYITPYHPRLWEVLRPLKGIDVLDRVRVNVAHHFATHGYALADFSHIESFDGDPGLFYDEVHMTAANQARLLEALLGGQPDAENGGRAGRRGRVERGRG